MSDLENVEEGQPGIGRRTIIKRGVVVGGLAWSAPVITGSLWNAAGAVGSEPPVDPCNGSAGSLVWADPSDGGGFPHAGSFTFESTPDGEFSGDTVQVKVNVSPSCLCDSTPLVYEWSIVNGANATIIDAGGSAGGTNDNVIVVQQTPPDTSEISINLKVHVSYYCGDTLVQGDAFSQEHNF